VAATHDSVQTIVDNLVDRDRQLPSHAAPPNLHV
jgi:hypothetical protein